MMTTMMMVMTQICVWTGQLRRFLALLKTGLTELCHTDYVRASLSVYSALKADPIIG